jgi:iron complex transport system substrate-binding protein
MTCMSRRLIAFAAIACAFVLLLAEGAWARQITDMTGRVVAIPDTIETVYAASPPETMLVYALDPTLLAGLNFPLEDKYIDVHTLNLPVIGGYFGQGKTPNLEKLVALNPDIVIGRKSNPLSGKFEAFLRKFNIPVANIVIDRLDQYPEALELLGRILGRDSRAKELIEYIRKTYARTKAVTSLIPAEKRVKVYYAEGVDGLRTESGASIHAEIIPLAGGINVHHGGVLTRYGKEKVTLETVIAYQPEVIFVEQPAFYKRIYSSDGWKSIPAVKNHRVYLIPRKPFNWFDRPPSFMRILGLKWVSDILYPERFGWDMELECREFFHLFLQKDISAEDARQLMSASE